MDRMVECNWHQTCSSGECSYTCLQTDTAGKTCRNMDDITRSHIKQLTQKACSAECGSMLQADVELV